MENDLKQLGLIDPLAPPVDAWMIKRIIKPFNNREERTYVWKSFVIFNRGRGTYNQLELPLPGVAWLIDVIENKFRKLPSEGGLPKDVFHFTGEVAGETINVLRGSCLGGEDIGGFNITNLSRASYIDEDEYQSHDITDHVLVEMKYMDFLRDLAARIVRGEYP
jgi:hypothetical protein